VRRVGVIALVHETLSQGFDETVNFDEIAVRGLQVITEVAKIEHPITSSVQGSFGMVRPEDATAIAMVLSELIQNAVEHGLAETGGGSICVEADRAVGENGDDLLSVTITDDGAGLPTDFKPGGSGLGTQIVQSLVQDLRGRIVWETAVPRGTRVRFVARLRPLSREA
jgi:two-component sensor histidine kinase